MHTTFYAFTYFGSSIKYDKSMEKYKKLMFPFFLQ